jgi:hypothetical protein
MYLASAYPNSALSAGLMTIIALVMAGALAIWLGLVFLADRTSRRDATPQAGSDLAVVTHPDGAAEDDQNGACPAPADRRHEAAA